MPSRQIVQEPLEKGERDDIAVDRLLLDPQNPRLAGLDIQDPDEIAKKLWDEMAVDEIALSIAANGFFPQEPLLVIRHGQKFFVVEGNRRLAAVMILRDDALRTKVGATDIPRIDDAAKERLKKLPVLIFSGREALWRHCGFRHINGTKPWDAFSKAAYIKWVYETVGVPLATIAERIGDRNRTVKRLYRGYKVLEQAESEAGFDRDDVTRGRFFFSHLYTAMDQPEFQKFLGITSDGSLKSNPVPRAKASNLKELMVWLYGKKSENRPPAINNQAPDLNYLREIIGNPRALSALRSGYSLARAREIALGDDRRFRENLTRAKEELQQAKGLETLGYKGETDLFELMKEAMAIASALHEDMEKKYLTAQKKK